MTPYLTFGEWLQRRRLSLGLTQAELGRRVGFAAETIRKVEADRRRPSRQMVEQLADALAIPPGDRPALLRFARDEGDPHIPLPSLPSALPDHSNGHIPHNLPAQTTLLIGRQRELDVVYGLLLREEVRLITLTGAGGTGKTRLALELARGLLERDSIALRSTPSRSTPSHSTLHAATPHPFTDGVYFVNLAPITDPGLVVSAIAQTLGVREMGGRPLLDGLKDYLQARDLLLILDNFEQVIEAAPVVADLLAHAPLLKVLVTSRETLHLRGEYDCAVPPLTLPPTGDSRWQIADSAETNYGLGITQYDAVRLFIARAQAAHIDFAVTHANAPAVAEICYRLDGLPLAIELAAARIKTLTPQVLLQRLERRLPVLVGGARDLPARQQTLRNTIDWSYDLLDEREKVLFRRLAVFVGGFTLDAAEEVCASGHRERSNEASHPSSLSDAAVVPLASDHILAGLTSLVDQSLLKQEEGTDGTPRFTMLETVREYALERLEASEEAEVIRLQHMDYCLALSKMAAPKFRGPEQLTWYRRLEAEHDNLRAALHWARERCPPETWLQLTFALSGFWVRRSYFDEARHWLEQAVEQTPAVTPLLRSRILWALGQVALRQENETLAIDWLNASIEGWPKTEDLPGLTVAMNSLGVALQALGHWPAARSVVEEALSIARVVGDKWIIAGPLRTLGHQAKHDGDYEKAQTLYNEARSLYQELGDKQSINSSLHDLVALASLTGDRVQGRRLAEERLANAREQDNKYGIAHSINDLGENARLTGDYERARQFYEESLALFRQLRFKAMIASLLLNLGYVAHYQGDDKQAESLFRESLAMRHEAKNLINALNPAAGLAGVWAKRGQLERAGRLLGAVKTQLDSLQLRLDPADQIEFDRNLADVQAQLTEETFNAAWAEGAAMSLEQTVEDALGEPELIRHKP